jgi:diguanylate cyclase (GGDEF)-like protein/PAS domain S-box-containing protein
MSTKLKSAGKPAKNITPAHNDLFHLAENVMSSIGVGIYIVQRGKFVYISPLYRKLTGYSDPELLGKNSLDRVHPDDRAMVREKAIKSLKGENPEIYEYRYIRKNGDVMWILEMITSVVYKGDRAALGSFMDITERKKMEETIQQSEERYRTIIEEMEEWYLETDLKGNILFFNDAVARALGYLQKGLSGMNFRAFMEQEQADEFFKIFNQIYKTGEMTKNFPYEFIRPDGIRTFAEFSISPKRDMEGKIYGFRGIGHDITERKRTEQQLNHIATHDFLTGLPNRMLFMDRLKMAIAQAKRNNQKLAVMMLDLDYFKNVNNSLGHMVGDQLLKEIGLRLTGRLRQNDTISRLGGDEFIILLPSIERREDSAEVAEIILKSFKQPFIFDHHKLSSSISIGIAIYPDDCQDMDSLLKYSDMAMYFVKAHGRNGYKFFADTN